MKPTPEQMRQYLDRLDPAALAEIEDSLRGALQRLRPDGRAEPARRPHLAMPERRGGDRYHVEMQANCRDAIFPANSDILQPVIVSDLSYAGCRFRSEKRVAPGRIVALQFTDPSGKARKVEVCVVRTRRGERDGREVFESGARTVTAEEVARSRREFREIEAICHRLSDHESIGLLHVLGGGAEEVLRARLRGGRYTVRETEAPPQFAGDVEGIDLIVCPAGLYEPGETGWPARIAGEKPAMGFLYVADGDAELARLAASGDIGQVLRAERVEEDLLLAIDQTLCGEQILQGGIEMEPSAFKILVAGPQERHLRQLETLLLQEDYLVTKCIRQDLTQTAAQREDFQVVVIAAAFCSGEGNDMLGRLHREDPLLTLVVEADDEQQIAEAMRREADLVLSPSANRQELLTRIKQACRIHKTRLYLA